MIVYLFSVEPLPAGERERYLALCEGEASAVRVEEGPLAALRAAAKARSDAREGVAVAIVGRLRDVVTEAPSEAFGEVEWHLAWIDCQEVNGVMYIPVGKSEMKASDGPTASIVRRYQRAAATLAERLAELSSDNRRQEGRAMGRPPYGYQSVRGRLLKNPKQAKCVREIFNALRKGQIVSEILTDLRKGSQRSKEFWDRVKIRRILDHAPLYCRGAFQTRSGCVVQPDLAFLPPAWESAVPARRGPSVPQSEEVGTLGA